MKSFEEVDREIFPIEEAPGNNRDTNKFILKSLFLTLNNYLLIICFLYHVKSSNFLNYSFNIFLCW